MAQIGTLLTGAGVTTIIAGQSQCDQFLLLGTVGTAFPLSGLQVEIDGKPFINIQGQAGLLTAIAKWKNETINGTGIVGVQIAVSTGRISRNTTFRLTNAGATTPAIFNYSDNQAGIPILMGSKTINASSYEDFTKFSALFIGTPANIGSAEMVFADGTKATLAGPELDAYFAYSNQAEASGELGGITVIDNTKQLITSVRLNIITAATTIAVVKLPDEAFKILTE
jgi:hypothetical protein